MTTRILLHSNSFAILVIATLFLTLVGLFDYESSYSQTSMFQIENTTTVVVPYPDSDSEDLEYEIKPKTYNVQNTSSVSQQFTDAPSYTTTNARTNIIENLMEGSTKDNAIAFNQSSVRSNENLVVGR